MKHFVYSVAVTLAVIGGSAQSAYALACGDAPGGVFCNATASVTVIESSSSSTLNTTQTTTGDSGFAGGGTYTLTVPGSNGVQLDNDSNNQMNLAVIYE